MRLGLKTLTEHMCRVLNRNLRIWSCSITNLAKSYNKLFWKWDIWKDDYEKSKNLTSFFMEFAVRNKKGQELDTSLFSGCQICSEVSLHVRSITGPSLMP